MERKTIQSKRVLVLMPDAAGPAYSLFQRSKGKSECRCMGEGRRARFRNAEGIGLPEEHVRAIGHGALTKYLRHASLAAIEFGDMPKSITLTSLRHGFASSSLSMGVDPNRAATFVGHSSPRQTKGLYGVDRIPGDMSDEVAEIATPRNDLLGGGRTTMTTILDGIQQSMDAHPGAPSTERGEEMLARVEARRRMRQHGR
jgi:integrase